MATLKHIASKNATYGRALEYLIFEHDEKGTPVRDEEGNKLMRKRFIIEGINCTPFSFDLECKMLNAQYQKNWRSSEIKSHHYIVSFDPMDKEEGRLTPEHAQKLGMEFAARCFPGHQTIVCTHDDGHNRSGNIHVHIIFNSLRKLDVDLLPFMDREIDGKAGYKHHLTDDYLKYLQIELMKICEREGLHQIDLLSPSKTRIRDGEYRARQHGQEKLDALNERIIAAQMKPTQTVFQTQKQFLREAIMDAAGRADSLETFTQILSEDYEIELKNRRGRFSFLHPERKKYITDRALGSAFEKDVLLEMIRKNVEEEQDREKRKQEDALTASVMTSGDTERFSKQDADVSMMEAGLLQSNPDDEYPEDRPMTDYDPDYDYHNDPIAILYVRTKLRLVVDLQTNIKAQMSEAYAQKVKISNLKEMARSVVFVQEYGYDSYEDLVEDQKYYSEQTEILESSIQETKAQLKDINAQIHFAGCYYSTRAVHADFLKAWNKKKFREAHREDLEKYDEAVRYFKENLGGAIPSMKTLRERKEELASLKDRQQEDLKSLRRFQKDLQTAITNVDAILGKDREPHRSRLKHRNGRTQEMYMP